MRLSRRISSRPDEFLRVFGELGAEPLEVAFQATVGWGWLADLLADAGIPAQSAESQLNYRADRPDDSDRVPGGKAG